MDGVLVDVRGSFHRTTLQTVTFFTGKRVTLAELQEWKNRSGFNDDWVLSTVWVQWELEADAFLRLPSGGKVWRLLGIGIT